MIDELQKVKQFVSNQDNWVQGKCAVCKDGAATFVYSPEAVKFCLSSVISKLGSSDLWKLINRKCLQLYAGGIIYVNDELGHEAVMEVLNACESDLDTELVAAVCNTPKNDSRYY